MNTRLQILVILIALLAILFIVNKIRRKSIELKYSLLWLLLGAAVILLACFPKVSNWVSGMLGISNPMNMMFFAGFCFTLPIIFSLSMSVSRLSNKVKKLTQEIGLLSQKIDELENKG